MFQGPPITLISDYDLTDPFLAQVKGVLASALSSPAYDLMHGLTDMPVQQAAFRWRRAWQRFPAGSIHLALQEPAEPAAMWVVSCQQQRLCGFTQSLLLEALPPGVAYEIRQYELPSEIIPTFVAREALVPLAIALAQGDECLDQLQHVSHGQTAEGPVWDNGSISGSVVDIDGFGNIITDILPWSDQDALHFIQVNRQRLTWTSSGNTGSRGYGGLAGAHTGSVTIGHESSPQPVAKGLWGCDGYLEISLFKGSAAKALTVTLGDAVIARLAAADDTEATRRIEPTME